MAADAPAVVLIDRALIRALLRYVRRLEREVGLLPPRPAVDVWELFNAIMDSQLGLRESDEVALGLIQDALDEAAGRAVAEEEWEDGAAEPHRHHLPRAIPAPQPRAS
jgi:hypothetical protein